MTIKTTTQKMAEEAVDHIKKTVNETLTISTLSEEHHLLVLSEEAFPEIAALMEEIHPELQSILDKETTGYGTRAKLNSFAKKARSLIKAGHDTGIEGVTPKKGSARAVFFHKDPVKLSINGREAHMPVVTKIAYPGALDKYRKHDEPLLGELQNHAENDHYKQQHYSVLQHEGGKEHSYNPEGILAPVIHGHEEGHHITMGRIEPLKSGEFRELTKHPDFPKGISHEEFHDALNHDHALAQGRPHYSSMNADRREKIKEHPLVNSFINFTHDTGSHPGDFNKRNLGVWTHPVSGQRKIVAADYGFNEQIGREYNKARRASMDSAHNKRWNN